MAWKGGKLTAVRRLPSAAVEALLVRLLLRAAVQQAECHLLQTADSRRWPL